MPALPQSTARSDRKKFSVRELALARPHLVRRARSRRPFPRDARTFHQVEITLNSQTVISHHPEGTRPGNPFVLVLVLNVRGVSFPCAICELFLVVIFAFLVLVNELLVSDEPGFDMTFVVPPHSDQLEVSFPQEHVLLLTLNRPSHLNAISPQLHRDLTAVLRWFDEEPRLWYIPNQCRPACHPRLPSRVVIITGHGRTFCAGADLKA